MSFKDHFSSHSAAYAAFRPTYPEPLVDYLASVAPGRELALDCGCGTGQLSVLLANRFARIVATDASAQQIENATPHERVEYRIARAEHSGLEDESVDLVTAAQAAHWFNLDDFYREVRRVLRPGGVIALITYGATQIEGEAGKLVSHFHYDVLGAYWPPERQLVEEEYRSLAFPFTELEPPRFTLRVFWTVDDLLGYIDTWSAVRQLEAAQGRVPFDRFAAELRAVWQQPQERREVRWPIHLRVGRVTDPVSGPLP